MNGFYDDMITWESWLIQLFAWNYWFPLFLTKASPTDRRTDRPTNGPTDGRTDRPGYRDARTHLKNCVTPSISKHSPLINPLINNLVFSPQLKRLKQVEQERDLLLQGECVLEKDIFSPLRENSAGQPSTCASRAFSLIVGWFTPVVSCYLDRQWTDGCTCHRPLESAARQSTKNISSLDTQE